MAVGEISTVRRKEEEQRLGGQGQILVEVLRRQTAGPREHDPT
jgi:hypothetical protein